MATVPIQEVTPVRSRVSIGAIVSGAVVALAVYLLLSLLGIALGLSISSHSTDEQLGIGAAVWALASLLIALFFGGFIVSQCTAGETSGEAAIYGVVMWGLVFALLLWMTAANVRFGFNAIMSTASSPANVSTAAPGLSDADLQKAGMSADEIKNYHAYADRVGAQMRTAAADPHAISAAWWTFAGVLFSMLAAMFGAVCGSGPRVVVAGFPVRTRFIREVRREPLHS